MAPAEHATTSAANQLNNVEELQLKIKSEDLGAETRLNELERLISEMKGIAAKYSSFSKDVRTGLDRAGRLIKDMKCHREALKILSFMVKEFLSYFFVA